METATKIPWRKSRATMTPDELAAKRAYDAQKARESRAHRRAEKDAQQAQTQPQSQSWASCAIFMCEALPDVPAKTSRQQVNTARTFGRALQQDDVHEGETCRQYVSRIFDAWKAIGFSPLHPLLLEFDRAFNEPTAFDIAEWVWPSDADALIEVNKLPSLP